MELAERSYLLINKMYYEEHQKEIFHNAFCRIEGFSFILFTGSALKCTHIFENNSRILFFVGDFYNPDHPELNNEETALSLYQPGISFEDIIDRTYNLFGKWFLVEDSSNGLKIFGDPCCTKSIKYHAKLPIISDMSSIIADIANEQCFYDLKSTNNDYYRFAVNDYRNTGWWTGKSTAFQNIFSILPNHIYSNNKSVIDVKRYLPAKIQNFTNENCQIEYCYERSSQLFKGFFSSLSNRSKIALTLTGGMDSRMLWAASHKALVEVHTFISLHGGKTLSHPDVVIAKKLCSLLNIELNIYTPIAKQKTIDKIKKYFPEISSAQIFAEMDYTEHFDENFKDTVVVNGWIPEVISRYYHRRLLFITPSGLSDLARHGGDFAKTENEIWLNNVKNASRPRGYSILDLFYWENRAGRWAAQTTNITDLYIDMLWGTNCREFFDIWMQLKNTRLRQYPTRNCIASLTRMFGEEYLSVEYDSPEKFMHKVAYFLDAHGIGLPFRQMEYILRRLKRKIR